MKINLLHIRNFIIIVIVFISCIVSGCRETTVEALDPFSENCLFVECNMLTDGIPKIGVFRHRDGDGYNFDSDNRSLIVYSDKLSGYKLKEQDKVIFAKKTDISAKIGGGRIGVINILEKFSYNDTINNEPFPGSYAIELVKSDENGDVTIRYNNKLITLRPKERYVDSVRIGNFILNEKIEYSEMIHYLTVTNYGFIQKKDIRF